MEVHYRVAEVESLEILRRCSLNALGHRRLELDAELEQLLLVESERLVHLVQGEEMLQSLGRPQIAAMFSDEVLVNPPPGFQDLILAGVHPELPLGARGEHPARWRSA